MIQGNSLVALLCDAPEHWIILVQRNKNRKATKCMNEPPYDYMPLPLIYCESSLIATPANISLHRRDTTL